MLNNKQRASDWSCHCRACDSASADTSTPEPANPLRLKCAYLQLHENFYSLSRIRSVVHTCTPTHKHSHSSGARPDCCGWRYLVESSITKGSLRSNQVCPDVNRALCQPSEDGPSLAGGREGHAGALHYIQRHINQVDGQWLGRGCGFERPTGTRLPLVTDSSVLQSILLPNEKQLERWGAHCSNSHLSSVNATSEGSWLFASASRMAELWHLMIKVTLGSY